MRLFVDSSDWNDNIEVRQLVLFVRTEVTMRSESLGLEIRRVRNDQSYRRLDVKLAVSYTTVRSNSFTTGLMIVLCSYLHISRARI